MFTIGHGRRPAEELVECLGEARVRTLVDVRRFPGSRRSPQFGQAAIAESLRDAGIDYRHTDEWQTALASTLAAPTPCLMCAETPWQRWHRRLISELLVARGHEVVHLIRPGERQPHRLFDQSEIREGTLYLCGARVA